MEKWINYYFESSSMETPEFSAFSKDIKKYIKNLILPEFILVNYNKGHFYFSGFLTTKDGTRTVYFSSSDVRYSQNAWYNNLLIRTAKHAKDYTGGNNDYCKLTELKEKALKLIN